MRTTSNPMVAPETSAGPTPPGSSEDAARRGWREALSEGLRITLLTRILFFVVAFDAAWLLTPGEFKQGFFEIWRKWDALHLLGIAEDGYFDPGDDSTTVTAFFPLYPLTVRAVS